MRLDVVSIHLAERRAMIDRLAVDLSRRFRLDVRVRNPWFDPEEAYDARRGQYHATHLLQLLLGDPENGAGRIIGVTGVDLFVPVLTHVFGEAQLDGPAAMVSFHRLRPEAYGLPVDLDLLYRRLLTEAVHELGHTYGLLHCDEPHCAMGASTYVEEIDLKRPEFCTGCLHGVFGGQGRISSSSR